MANKLYSAYRGAGKASSSYKASLYDIENLGIEREASQSMYQFETAQRDKNLSLIQEGIGLASDLYGGYKAKKKLLLIELLCKKVWLRNPMVNQKLKN